MQIQCSNCSTVYEVDDGLVPQEGCSFQCTVCNAVFFAKPGQNIQLLQRNQQGAIISDQQYDQIGNYSDNYTESGNNEEQTIRIDQNAESTQPIENVNAQSQGSNSRLQDYHSQNVIGQDPIEGQDVTTYPMQDPQPPQIDFTLPKTAQPPTELPTGYVSDPSKQSNLEQDQRIPSFSPPTSHLEFDVPTIPPPPTSTPAEFNPYDSAHYGNIYQQSPKKAVYTDDLNAFTQQSIGVVNENIPTEDQLNQTNLWNVRIGDKVQRGLQLIQLKNWIRAGTLRESDEVQEPGGPWIYAGDSPELHRFFTLKEKIESEKLLTKRTGKKVLNYCINHSSDEAMWECANCGRFYCDDCVDKKKFGPVTAIMCKKCNDRCIPIEKTGDVTPFWQDIPDMFLYPIKKHGPVMIAIGTILAFFANLILLMTFGFGWFMAVALWGIVFSYFLSIVRKSSLKIDKGFMPDFPDVTEGFWSEMILPYFQTIIAFILYFLIPIILSYWFMSKYSTFFITVENGEIIVNQGLATVIFIAFFLGGAFMFPMVISVLAVHKTVLPAFNPIIIMRLIKRVIGRYTLMIIFQIVLIVLSVLLNYFLNLLGTKLAFPGIFVGITSSMMQFYFICVMARLLGLFLKEAQDDLAWTST